MGSFTELTLAFRFAEDAPPDLLGAFVEWRTGEDAPSLPTLEESLGDDVFDADMHLNYFGGDPMGDALMGGLSLLQRAAVWRDVMQWGANAYFPGTPMTALRWNRYGGYWTLTTRTLPKEGGELVQAAVAPLGEWATDGTPDRPQFVGYIYDEYSPRPVLIWSVGRQPFQFEGQFLY